MRLSRSKTVPRKPAFQAQIKNAGVTINSPVRPSKCGVVEADRVAIEPIIVAHEWLGTLGKNVNRFWLLHSPDGQWQAAAAVATTRHNTGTEAAVLYRGCMAPGAHRNAASRLIGRICKMLKRDGFEKLVAYSDVLAGERGTIYRAVGMHPVENSHGPGRQRVRPPGVACWEQGKCHSDSWLRHGGQRWSPDDARRHGYVVEPVPSRQRWERAL